MTYVHHMWVNEAAEWAWQAHMWTRVFNYIWEVLGHSYMLEVEG